MGKFSIANLKKTIYYFQRNGLRNTWIAARERLSGKEDYHPEFLSEDGRRDLRREAQELMESIRKRGGQIPFFSILVPAYRTNPVFLRELTESLQEQIYPGWELLILDASEDEQVRETLVQICEELEVPMQAQREAGLKQRKPGSVQGEAGLKQRKPGSEQGESDLKAKEPEPVRKEVGSRQDAASAEQSRMGSVRYVALTENAGISENTNAGLELAQGNYIGLLDHDDVLAPDALYEMAKAIATSEIPPLSLYSDEDKWDGAGRYYEPNRKEAFNLDLLLSNNYICHFLVMETSLFQRLRLRREFDGAQDYDLVLRAAAWMMGHGIRPEEGFCHISKILYHWRCHSGSTAENPRSKTYAYEAGKRALQDFADAQGWHAVAEDLKHVGFYRLQYEDILQSRSDLGAVGGKLVGRGKAGHRGRVLIGGRMSPEGDVYYEGLQEGFSGCLHRAVLTQDAEAVDLRCIRVARKLWPQFERIVGVPYVEKELCFDASTLPENADVKALSLAFCSFLREQGRRILWDPELTREL